jgi:hypothetical protein
VVFVGRQVKTIRPPLPVKKNLTIYSARRRERQMCRPMGDDPGKKLAEMNFFKPGDALNAPHYQIPEIWW